VTDPRAFLGRGWAWPVALDDSGCIMSAAGEEDIRQAIHIILFTSHERVMRPEFGAGLDDFLFEPMNTTTLSLVRHRVEEAITLWEPRVNLLDVRVREEDRGLGKLRIEIDCLVRETNTFFNLVYPFYLTEGERQ
jgi:phage baseplate assembly protein W